MVKINRKVYWVKTKTTQRNNIRTKVRVTKDEIKKIRRRKTEFKKKERSEYTLFKSK